MRGYLTYLLWIVVIAAVVQYVFIATVPNIIFAIAKHRSAVPANTIIHAPKTDANLRRVVLPNPDFVYSAVFYDLNEGDLMITGVFPDSNQYCSLAFYGNNMQPYKVITNQDGKRGRYTYYLLSHRSSNYQPAIRPSSKQGSLLMRILVTDSASRQKALQVRDSLRVVVFQ